MSWTIRLSAKADKYFKKLDKKKRKQFKEELRVLSEYSNPLKHIAIKSLTGNLKGFHRLRIGDYRIIFGLISEDRILAVVNIAPRGNVY